MTRTLFFLATVGMFGGCTGPHLTQDFGRAYMEAFTAQPDLTRRTIEELEYDLGGFEGTEIRLRQQESATNEEEAKAEHGLTVGE